MSPKGINYTETKYLLSFINNFLRDSLEVKEQQAHEQKNITKRVKINRDFSLSSKGTSPLSRRIGNKSIYIHL